MQATPTAAHFNVFTVMQVRPTAAGPCAAAGRSPRLHAAPAAEGLGVRLRGAEDASRAVDRRRERQAALQAAELGTRGGESERAEVAQLDDNAELCVVSQRVCRPGPRPAARASHRPGQSFRTFWGAVTRKSEVACCRSSRGGLTSARSLPLGSDAAVRTCKVLAACCNS